LNTIELKKEHLDAYWTALSDLGIEGVVAACAHLARHFKPTYAERFPVPATIREEVYAYHREQHQRQRVQALLPPPDVAPDEEALAHIAGIVAMLEAKMDMKHAARDSAAARLEARKIELLAQSQRILAEEHARKECDDAE
jgi:hypothetical protein